MIIHNDRRSRDVADRMLKKWGAPAVLRRQGMADRACTAFITSFSPMERMGQMSNPLDRKAIVSALGPDGETPVTPDPTEQLDRLITFKKDRTTGQSFDPPQEDENLRITQPPNRVETAGLVLLWELSVRR